MGLALCVAVAIGKFANLTLSVALLKLLLPTFVVTIATLWFIARTRAN